MRVLLPPGAGDPTKLMAEKFWQGLDPCPLTSTCSTHGEHNEDPLAACGLCGYPAVGMTTGAENGEEHLSLPGTSASPSPPKLCCPPKSEQHIQETSG